MADAPSKIDTETTTEVAEQPNRFAGKDPGARGRQLANLRPAWRPGQSGNPKGRPRGQSFTEILRAVAEGPIPHKLRDRVAKRLGTPLHVVDEMSMQDLIATLMFFDYIEKGKFEQAQGILDRIDPKSRRVELDGEIRHKHAHIAITAGMTEAQAAEAYRDTLTGGGIIDLEPLPTTPPGVAATEPVPRPDPEV